MNIDQHVEAVRVKVREDYKLELHEHAVTLARLHYLNQVDINTSANVIGEALLKDIKDRI